MQHPRDATSLTGSTEHKEQCVCTLRARGTNVNLTESDREQRLAVKTVLASNLHTI